MAGWASNWETSHGIGKLLKPALYDLRKAINERAVAAGLPVLNYPVIERGTIITSAFFAAFEAKMNDIIPLSFNHTIQGGDYTGLDDLPYWTEADLLTEIGDATRIPAPVDPIVSASWMWQQYRMLNKLLWFALDVPIPDYNDKSADGADWAETENNFIAAGLGPSSIAGYWRGDYDSNNTPPYYKRGGVATYTHPSTRYIEADAYVYPRLFSVGYEFAPIGVCTVQNKWQLYDTLQATQGAIVDIYKESDLNSNLTEPTASVPNVGQAVIDVNTPELNPVFVGKYDGTNGFEYIS